MISDRDLVARIDRLDVHILRQWVEIGLIAPQQQDPDYAFDEADVARVHLVCDLYFEMGVEQETLPVVLSLLDQLHGARRALKALGSALNDEPEEARRRIAGRVAAALGSPAHDASE